jgi:hypothetical protein
MKMSTSVCLKLEGIVGASPEQVAADAVGVANRVLCMVEIEMNGVTLYVRPGHDPEELRRSYEMGQKTRQTLAAAKVVVPPHEFSEELVQQLCEAGRKPDNQPL